MDAVDTRIADFARAAAEAAHLDDPLAADAAGLRPLGWGVVGPGAIAQRVVPDIAALADANLVAVSSRSAQRARDFANAHGFATAYWDDEAATGLAHLCADPDVDVVYVATPHGHHFDQVRALLEAGKSVVCEKALAITAAEVRELTRIAAARGCLLMEAVWTVMTPGFRRAIEIVASGEIGQVRQVSGQIGFSLDPDPQSRLFAPADGGGVILDMLIYPLLYSDAFQGEVRRSWVTGSIGPTGVDDDVALLLQREGGTAQLSGTLARMPDKGVFISGTDGSLRIPGRFNNPARLEVTRLSAPDAPRVEEIATVGAGYSPQMREATRCVRAGTVESPLVPWAASIRRAELFDELRERVGVRLPNDERTDLHG